MKNTSLRRFLFAVALVAISACGQADATPNADLERDLAATSVSEFELANQNTKRTDIVSRAERVPVATRPVVTRAPIARGTTIAPASSKDVATVVPGVDTSLTAPRPRSTPQTQQERRGPYKTVGEIIKNAPFPINP